MFDCVLKHASDFFFFFMASIYVCVISVVKADLYWQLIRKLKNADMRNKSSDAKKCKLYVWFF